MPGSERPTGDEHTLHHRPAGDTRVSELRIRTHLGRVGTSDSRQERMFGSSQVRGLAWGQWASLTHRNVQGIR
jgi:hypothetical protein